MYVQFAAVPPVLRRYTTGRMPDWKRRCVCSDLISYAVSPDNFQFMNLAGIAEEVQHRLIHIFGRDEHGRRAVNGGNPKLNRDPNFRDYVHFYEVNRHHVVYASDGTDRYQFFHGNDGRGLGASHQTGWTGLVAWSIMQTGEYCRLPKTPRSAPRPIYRMGRV